jgi:hypothetical protein
MLTIGTAYTAAVKGWGVADSARQMALVESAKNADEARAEVSAWRAGPQTTVNKILATFGGSVLAAKRAWLMYELKQAGLLDVIKALQQAWGQFEEVRAVLTQYGIVLNLGGL